MNNRNRRDGRSRRTTRASRPGGVLLKLVVILAAVAVLGGGGYAYYATRGLGPSATAIEHYRVDKMSFDVTSTANGELKAKDQTELNSPLETEAAIVEIVPEGTFVKEGDVLCKLNIDDIQKQLDEESLALESARSDMISATNAYEIQLSDNESNIRKAQVKVEMSQIGLQKWLQGDVAEKRQELSLMVETQQREVERLKKKVELSRQLHAKEFLSTNDLEIDERDYAEALSKLETAKLKSSVYEEFTYREDEKKHRSELDESLAELERAKRKAESEIASKDAERSNKRQQLAMRERKVEKLKGHIAASIIKAPTGGLVVYSSSIKPDWYFDSRGPIKVGRKIFPNESIIVLPDTREMIAAIKIHESLISQIKPGQEALVTIDAKQGKKFAGKVDSIGILAESGGWRDPNLREYEVKIALQLPEGDHGLKPSMRCESQIVRDHVKDSIAVPIQAVFNEGPVQFVYREVGNQYERAPVKVGRRSDTHAELLAGIGVGETVMLRAPEAGRIVKGDFDPKVLADLGIDLNKDGKTGGAKMIMASNAGASSAATATSTEPAKTETAAASTTETKTETAPAEKKADETADANKKDGEEAAKPETPAKTEPAEAEKTPTSSDAASPDA